MEECLYRGVCCYGECECRLGRHSEIDWSVWKRLEQECEEELAHYDKLNDDDYDF